VLVAVRLLVDPGFVVAILLTAVVSLVVVRQTRHDLDLLALFPELRRIRPLRRFLS